MTSKVEWKDAVTQFETEAHASVGLFNLTVRTQGGVFWDVEVRAGGELLLPPEVMNVTAPPQVGLTLAKTQAESRLREILHEAVALL